MKICCLGWGSLIWDPRDLPLGSIWRTDGPLLPIEFARQSADDRITLVVTPDALESPVLWAELDVDTVQSACSVLAAREGIPAKFVDRSVGFWSGDGKRSNHEQADVVGEWAVSKGLAGVVWTALKPKIGDEYRTPSLDEVVLHISGLDAEPGTKAKEYISKTPPQIQTEYRSAICRRMDWNV